MKRVYKCNKCNKYFGKNKISKNSIIFSKFAKECNDDYNQTNYYCSNCNKNTEKITKKYICDECSEGFDKSKIRITKNYEYDSFICKNCAGEHLKSTEKEEKRNNNSIGWIVSAIVVIIIIAVLVLT